MKIRLGQILCLTVGIAPIAVFSAQQATAEPTCEQVFKNIQVFKGVPASDMIPSMEFMSASLGYQCSSCHDPKDFAAETPGKEAARSMVLMQRDINTKYFRGRLEVTCMSCHGGKSHPVSTPIPQGIALRHERIETTTKADDLFAKHIATVGKEPASLTRIGTLTAPNDATHEVETKPLEFTQAEGGKFRLVAGDRKFGSNGTEVWYGPAPMMGEPANIFGRIGRAWRGNQAFAGLEKLTITGKDTIGKTSVLVVRGTRASTGSTEELYFDPKGGVLMRMVNIKRSTLGSVVSVIDYSNYKVVSGAKVPMKVVVTFAGDEKWTMNFKSAKVDAQAKDSDFAVGGAR